MAELSTEDADELQFSLILEPDSLRNLIVNIDVHKCVKAYDVYREATSYVCSPAIPPSLSIGFALPPRHTDVC